MYLPAKAFTERLSPSSFILLIDTESFASLTSLSMSSCHKRYVQYERDLPVFRFWHEDSAFAPAFLKACVLTLEFFNFLQEEHFASIATIARLPLCPRGCSYWRCILRGTNYSIEGPCVHWKGMGALLFIAEYTSAMMHWKVGLKDRFA